MVIPGGARSELRKEARLKMAINLCDMVLIGNPDPKQGCLHSLAIATPGRTRCGLPIQPNWKQPDGTKREMCFRCLEASKLGAC